MTLTKVPYWMIIGAPANVLNFGADPSGATDSSAAIQAAIDAVTPSGVVVIPEGTYLLSSPLDCTTTALKDRSGLTVVSDTGRRGGVTFLCNTDDWVIDLTGSAWTYWKGLYFTAGPSTPSKGVFFAAGSAYSTECLNNTFEQIYIELYNVNAPSSYGTVGYGIIGSEENTWLSCQTFANTPLILSTVYSTVNADYPAPFGSPQAAHSCGANTFSGANALNTFDKTNANIYLYGANTIDFGNMYCGNVTIGTPQSNETVITILGGTIENLKGSFKIENKSSLIDSAASEWYNFDLAVAFGGGTLPSYAVINLPTPTALVLNKYLNINVDVSYYAPADAAFLHKKLITATGVSGGVGNEIPDIANWVIRVNQESGLHGNPFFPAQFCGVAVNCKMEFPDCNYLLDKHRHVKKIQGNIHIGNGNGPGDIIAKIVLPAITANFSARAIGVRVDGLIAAINEAAGGSETSVTCCYFNTSKGAYSTNNGVITVAADGASSDLLKDTTSIAMSDNAAQYLYTGITLDMNYNAGQRDIDLIAVPRGSGTNLGSVAAFVNDPQVELVTSGRIQELIYIS